MRGAWRGSATVLMAILLGASLGAQAGADDEPSAPVLMPNQGPYARPVLDPVARVTAFDAELWAWTEGTRTSTVALPEADWDRVLLRFHSWPNGANGDPWDRLFTVRIEDVEVMRGVTTRGDFEVRDDITEYAALLAGTTARIGVHLSSWEGSGVFATVDLLFHHEATSLAGDAPADQVVRAFTHRGLGSHASTAVAFPDAPPAAATIELFTTGHGQDGEFWYLNALGEPEPPRFQVYVDGTHVGTVHAMPYVYALLGFCCTPTSWLINQHLWWSAHQVLNEAGVYTGVGIVPSYRAELPAQLLPLLAGERSVEIVKETHGGHWPTSVTFLLEQG